MNPLEQASRVGIGMMFQIGLTRKRPKRFHVIPFEDWENDFYEWNQVFLRLLIRGVAVLSSKMEGNDLFYIVSNDPSYYDKEVILDTSSDEAKKLEDFIMAIPEYSDIYVDFIKNCQIKMTQ
jgi:hypothetical protein